MMDSAIIPNAEVDSGLVSDVLGIRALPSNGRLVVSSQEVEAGVTRLQIMEPVRLRILVAAQYFCPRCQALPELWREMERNILLIKHIQLTSFYPI